MDAYESLGAIGEGTYGVVIRARHKATGQVVAIKRFKESEEDEQTRKTSLREVRVLKQLKNDNIVGLLDVFRRKGKLHIVFEYIEKTILEVLDATPRGIDTLSVKKYMYQLLKGLEFCHSQNIIHRDVKPENILISERGTLKICDFGFARPMVNGGKYTDYVATRWYRAPELLVGDVEYGKAVDVWAVGCIFSEISTGQPLFPGESDFDQLAHILRCCGKIPQRFVQIFYNNPLYKNVDLPSQRVTESLDDRFRNPPSSGWLTFIKSCLRCDPSHRDPCSTLLQSPYFEDTSDFIKDKYDAYLQTVYEQEQFLKTQLMAVSPPPSQPQPPTVQPGTASLPPSVAQRTTNALFPDLGARAGSASKNLSDAHPSSSSNSNTTPIAVNTNVNKQAPSTLWSQYLASASHELPELGAKPSTNAMPTLVHTPNAPPDNILSNPKNPIPTSTTDKSQPYIMKTTATKLPTTLSSMPSLQPGAGAYRLPTLDANGGSSIPPLYHSSNTHNNNPTSFGAKAPTPTPPGSQVPVTVKVKDRTSLSLSTSGPDPNGLPQGHKSPTPPNSISVTGQGGGKSSPTPTSSALTSQLAYKKKPHKKNVLTSLNFTSFESQQQGTGLVVGGSKHTGLNSGLDPFGGSLFAPNQSNAPRNPNTYSPSTVTNFSLPQERRGSNANVYGNQNYHSPPVNHLYTSTGNTTNDIGRLSDLILKGRTSQPPRK